MPVSRHLLVSFRIGTEKKMFLLSFVFSPTPLKLDPCQFMLTYSFHSTSLQGSDPLCKDKVVLFQRGRSV